MDTKKKMQHDLSTNPQCTLLMSIKGRKQQQNKNKQKKKKKKKKVRFIVP